MKKIFYSVICLMAMVSCNDDELNKNGNSPLSIAEKDLTLQFKSAAEGKNIRVNSSAEWSVTVTSGSEWLSAEKLNSQTLKVAVTANGLDVRQGSVSVSGSGVNITISVEQIGDKPAILITPGRDYTAAAAADTLYVAVTANVPYEVAIPDTCEWLTQGAKDGNTEMLLIAENTSAAERVASVRFRSTREGDTTFKSFLVTQRKASIDISPASFNAKANGDTLRVTITSLVEVDYDIPTAAQSWISYIRLANDKHEFKVEALTNPNDERSATLTFKHRGGMVQTQLNVRQTNKAPYIRMKIASATANLRYNGKNTEALYDGNLDGGFYQTTNAAGEKWFSFVLDQTANTNLNLAGIRYYPRLGTVATTRSSHGHLATGEIWVKTTTNSTFTKVMDIPEQQWNSSPKEFILDQPIQDVTEVKLVALTTWADGGTSNSNANYFAAREVEILGASRSDVSTFVQPDRSIAAFDSAGGTIQLPVANNSAHISYSGGGNFTITNDNGMLTITAAANTGADKVETLTVTGNQGGSATITLRQLAGNAQVLAIADASAIAGVAGSEGSTDISNSPDNMPMSKLYDGNKNSSSYWHSDYGHQFNFTTHKPYTLDFTLNNVSSVSYINYYARNFSSAFFEGDHQYAFSDRFSLGNVEIWTKGANAGDTWVKQLDGTGGELFFSQLVLPQPVPNVKYVRMVVKTVGTNNADSNVHFAASEIEIMGQ